MFADRLAVDSAFRKAGLDAKGINTLISNINSDLMCDASCKKDRKLAKLQEEYEKAKLNEANAPQEALLAKKAYISFRDGAAAYTQIENTRIQNEVNREIDAINTEFQSEATDAASDVAQYNISYKYVQNVNELVSNETDKFEKLNKDIDTFSNNVYVNNRLNNYYNATNEWRDWVQWLIHLFYWLTLSIFVLYYILWQGRYKNKKLWIIVFASVILPFIIYRLISFQLLGYSIENILDKMLSIFLPK